MIFQYILILILIYEIQTFTIVRISSPLIPSIRQSLTCLSEVRYKTSIKSNLNDSITTITPSTDYFKIFNTSRETFSASKLKSSFINLAKLHHPDAGGEEETMMVILTAYEVLKDPLKRSEYERSGKVGGSIHTGSRWDDYVRGRKKQKVSRRRRAVVGGRKELTMSNDVPEYLRDKKLARVGDVVYWYTEVGEVMVGLVVSRNIDRGDVGKVVETARGMGKDPNVTLELCEVSTLERLGGEEIKFR